MRLKRKIFTKYDDTDALKRMNDADILAEKKKKPSMTTGRIAANTAVGAGVGAGIGAMVGGLSKGGFKKGGKYGALIGAGTSLVGSLMKRNKQNKDNQFYNNRLDYAQRQARRREKKDWKQNMTQREGYSY